MAENRQYDHEYIVQAVKLAKEIGQARAAQEPGAPGMPCMAGCRPNGITKADRKANTPAGFTGMQSGNAAYSQA